MTSKSHTIMAENIRCTADSFEYYVKTIGMRIENGEKKVRGFWVTDVCTYPKEFECKEGEKAYKFDCLADALNFVAGCGANGYPATCEIIPTWTVGKELYLTNKEER